MPLAAEREFDHAFLGQVRIGERRFFVRDRIAVYLQPAVLDLTPRFAVGGDEPGFLSECCKHAETAREFRARYLDGWKRLG